MKEYIFEDMYVASGMLRITIKALDFESAYFILLKTAKNSADFKCLNP